MKQIIGIMLVITLISTLSICEDAHAESGYFWIDKDAKVLIFIGDPHRLNLKVAKSITYEKQRVKLFHKKSGPGIYAFDLAGLIVRNMFGDRATIKDKGYFLAKKRQVSKKQYGKKTSMKHKTKIELLGM
jgi:hypothetical protein